jgi:Rrf2 family transcriptional regulator, cysteine metabolism repressor
VKFSARVSYGLRAASVLGERYGQGPVLGKQISEAEALPPAYLEQIMASLRRAELVSGTRGARGGYVLSRSPEQITVTELISALEGPIQLSECPGGASCCASPETCAVRELFAAGESALHEVFDNRRLSDLIVRREALREQASMYHI